MIKLTKIDDSIITINADEIEIINTTHDSAISLKSGKRIIVKENSDEIIRKVIQYKQECFAKVFTKIEDIKILSQNDEE